MITNNQIDTTTMYHGYNITINKKCKIILQLVRLSYISFINNINYL